MVSCECCEIFKSSLFYRTPWVAASELCFMFIQVCIQCWVKYLNEWKSSILSSVPLYRNHHYKSLYDTKNYQWVPVEHSSKLSTNKNVRCIQEKIERRRSEAVTRSYSVKKVFLNFLKNLQENTCTRVSFLIKPEACDFIKKETLTQVFFCEFCEIFKKTFFIERLWWLLLDNSNPLLIQK